MVNKFDLIKKECRKLQPGSLMDEGSHLTSFSLPSKASVTPTTDKMKVEIKLQTYDGTPYTCSEWFYNLEKALQ